MKDNMSTLLGYLWHHYENWVSAAELSQLSHVSTRQVRKYISILNEEHIEEPLVISTNKGYKLSSTEQYLRYRESGKHNLETPQTQQNLMMQKLISSKSGIDISDLAQEFYVSESTMDNDIRSVRKTISAYQIGTRKEKDVLLIDDSEKEERQLVSRSIISDFYDNFVLKDEVQLLTYHYHFWDFRRNLSDIFSHNNLFANDYTLDNTALHLIVMIDRIRSSRILHEQVDLTPFFETPQYTVTREIWEYIEGAYAIQINDAELHNLTLIVMNNTMMTDYSFINGSNISSFVEQRYIGIARTVIHNVEECYLLDPFDEESIAKPMIHVKNLFNRVERNYYARNPLTTKIKSTYPLIYDITVYIAQQFKDMYDIILNEDEIAFISFHIGSYFENNIQLKNKLIVLFLYADYYSLHQNTLEKISRRFEDKVTTKYAMSIHSYQSSLLYVDLIISTVETPFPQPSIIIHPFLIEKNMNQFENAITRMLAERNKNKPKEFLFDLSDLGLFYTDMSMGRARLIQTLCNDAIRLDYADASFTTDVFARKHMSSTAFEDAAVPHSLVSNAKRSFISVVLCPQGMEWGAHEAHIATLLGVHDDSKKLFAQIFDHLTEILSEPSFPNELVTCQDYDSFIQKLAHYMDAVDVWSRLHLFSRKLTNYSRGAKADSLWRTVVLL